MCLEAVHWPSWTNWLSDLPPQEHRFAALKRCFGKVSSSFWKSPWTGFEWMELSDRSGFSWLPNAVSLPDLTFNERAARNGEIRKIPCFYEFAYLLLCLCFYPVRKALWGYKEESDWGSVTWCLNLQKMHHVRETRGQKETILLFSDNPSLSL